MLTSGAKHTRDTTNKHYCYWKDGDLYVAVYVQPLASKNIIAGKHGDRLKIQIASPPVDGKANSELLKFLSNCLDIPKTRIELISGIQGRNKLIKIKNPSKQIELLLR